LSMSNSASCIALVDTGWSDSEQDKRPSATKKLK
jgi:hypothetical protein